MTTTTFRIILILPSMGMKLLAAQSKRPTTIKTMTTEIKLISEPI